MSAGPAVALAALAALAYAAGSVLQSVGVRGGSGPRDLVRSPLYLTGLGCDGGAFLLSLLALRQLPVFVVQAVLAGSLALTVVLARLALRARLRRRDTAAVLATVTALAVVGAAGAPEGAPTAGRGLQVALVVAALACAAALPVLARLPALARPRSRASSPAHAVLAGLAFSAAALAARAVHVDGSAGLASAWRLVLQPLGWVVVAAGVVGTLAYATALERGPVGPATALLWVVEVVVPALAGTLLLGDAVRPGWGAPAVAALAVVVAAAGVLATSPAVPEEAA